MTEMIAHYIEEILFPRCDFMADLHSGGSSLLYIPSVQAQLEPSGTLAPPLRKLVEAFNAPCTQVYASDDEGPNTEGAARRKGLLYFSTELAGAGMVTPAAYAAVERGLPRALAQLGVLRDTPAGPDGETPAQFVNIDGDSSIRGGAIAKKCYNPQTPTRDRLRQPLLRIYGALMPVPWDFALDIAAEVGKHVIATHGANAYGMKTYSYQYMENTYAITKYALRHINTANFTFHDTPSDVTSTPGFRDAGFDNFAPSYEDWRDAETLLICGTDPYETKTILFTQWIMPGIQNGQRTIFMVPRRTAGIAHAEANGGMWIVRVGAAHQHGQFHLP